MKRCRLIDLLPPLARVIDLHGCCSLGGVLPEVLLVDDAALVHDERHDSRRPVLCRVGHHGKAKDHPAVDHVIEGPSIGILALCLQYLEQIAMVR